MSGLHVTRKQGPWDAPEPERNVTLGTDGTIGKPTIYDSEVDIRFEMGEVLRNRGHKIVLRRATRIRCPNWDPATSETHTKKCVYCMGTGYMYQDVVVRSYCRPAVDVESQAKEKRYDVGVMSQGKRIYYFDYTMWPKIADYILEVELDADGEPVRVWRVLKVFDIQVVHPHRDKAGRVEFYEAQCSERPSGA